MKELIYINLVPSFEREAFSNEVRRISSVIGINPNWLMQVMYSESGVKSSSKLKLKSKWPDGTNKIAGGLIGFMPETAASYGTTVESLITLSNVAQLAYVEKFYSSYRNRLNSYYDVYAVTFFPLMVGKPDDFILQTKKLKASQIAKQNPAININKDDVITVGEFKQYVWKTVKPQYRDIVFSDKDRIDLYYTASVGASGETVNVNGVGNVQFLQYERPTQAKTEVVFAPDSSPLESVYGTEAGSIAASSVQEYYPPQEASKILQEYAPNLFPITSPVISLEKLFSIFNSFDFFQKRITTVPATSIASTARERLRILDTIRNNPLFPMNSRIEPLSLETNLSVEEIRQQIVNLGITDDRVNEISDKTDLIVYVKEQGYAVTEKIDPLKNIEEMIVRDIAAEESPVGNTDSAYDCPISDIVLANYNIEEINTIANNQCKIKDITEEQLDIPEIEDPILSTPEEIESVINNIESIGDEMLACGQEKGAAEVNRQKYMKVREDLYPVYVFMKERYEFMKKLDKKEASPVSSFSPESLMKILSSPTFNLETLINRSILKSSDSENFVGYSNQSGITPDKSQDFFLVISEQGDLLNEIEDLYNIHAKGKVLKNFIVKSTDPKKSLEKIVQNVRGFYYENFYNKFNSADRVDFLFTYTEQGYLTPKVSNSDLLTDDGHDRIKDVKIDEKASIDFLKNYSNLERERVNQKLEDLHKNEFFERLKTAARIEASTVHQVLSSSFVTGLGFLAIKKLREDIEKEYGVINGFYNEISTKIESLEKLIEEKQSCIDKHVNDLETAYGSAEEDNIPEAGNDPFGSTPPDPRLPGPSKNHYWKQFTKSLQTVSLMPIPDIKYLTKRLFRYYPVGLQIDVPVPPKVLPTLASGIPDTKISIPFPIVWKHLVTLNTPVGQFVLWLTYCAPYTFSPYLMYIDESQNFSFLKTPKGKVEIPAKSMKWDESSALAKSIIDRIPGLKIPMNSLPPVDNSVNNKTPDNIQSSVQELRSRIKTAMDKLNSSSTATERAAENSMLRRYGSKINSTLDVDNGFIDTESVKKYLNELKTLVKKKTYETLDFEPFEIPKTQKKRSGELSTVTEFKNAISKIKALKNAGAMIETKSINLEKIIVSKSLSVLDTEFGKKVAADLNKSLNEVNKELDRIKEYRKSVVEKERSKTILQHTKKILAKAVEDITPKTLGFVESPSNPVQMNLPSPAISGASLDKMPVLISQALKDLKNGIVNFKMEDVQESFSREFLASIDVSGRMPVGRDLLAQSIIHGNSAILKSLSSAIPGWPNDISYPTSISMLKQAVKDAKNAVWKIKFRITTGGIPPIKISPGMVKSIASPVIDSSIDFIFARLLSEFDSLAFEQSGNTSIKLRNSLQIVKAIFGSELWDINEQDVKSTAIAFSREVLQEIDSSLESAMKVVDVADKSFESILKKFAPFSKQKAKLEDSPKIDTGSPIAKAMFATITAKLVSGEIPAPPYPVVLLGCALGAPGWKVFTKVDPFRAIEKMPPYERLSLKNVPFVLFLDMLVATSQRYGGVGSNYVPPYFTPDS